MEIDQSWKSQVLERVRPFLVFKRAVDNPVSLGSRKLIATLDQIDAFPALGLVLDLPDMRNDGRKDKSTQEVPPCLPLAGGFCQIPVNLVSTGVGCQRKLRYREPIWLK